MIRPNTRTPDGYDEANALNILREMEELGYPNPEDCFDAYVRGVRYPHIQVQLTGKDGNAFAVMGEVVRALRAHDVPKEEVDKYTQEAKSGNYDHLLLTSMQWVDVL